MSESTGHVGNFHTTITRLEQYIWGAPYNYEGVVLRVKGGSVSFVTETALLPHNPAPTSPPPCGSQGNPLSVLSFRDRLNPEALQLPPHEITKI